ncbi:EAL domain-containing protein [Sphingomonas sp. S-NIH.Pt15_0812]|uniref:putative bifunctional diguanylate cyclase/phosphodiesterase n=1 Tax=Sphingomonas sp. S-NIH.Pt15_0812 TaxID=1920129 RepID=UPI000F7F03C3|nr:EAL domain-containing protein [Sphingomonas sp. S-NIH.Pt15_0812]RSU47030.1 hypothetical protein BRX43_14800 [Sphingomonas sp. S-NIH.Pt15_0812]
MSDAADLGTTASSSRALCGRFIDWLTLRYSSPQLAADQLRDVSQYIALIYGIVAANMVFCFWGSWTTISPWVIGAILLPIAAIVTLRIRWWRALPDRVARDGNHDLRSLRITVVIMPVAALALSTMAILACRTWHAMMLETAVLFVMLCVIACMFCLRALPQAALLVASVVLLPHLFFAIRTGAPNELLTIGQLAVLLAIVQVMLTISFRQFRALSESRRALMAERCAALQRADEQQRLARRDSLTNLCNRTHFFDIFDRMMAADDTPFAVAVIDLDRFKQVNDLHGHAVGDQLLMMVGERLRAAGSRSDTDGGIVVGRLGGDEFGALIPAGIDPLAWGEVLCESFARPFSVQELEIAGRCTVGVAQSVEGMRCSRELYGRADHALYRGKAEGRGRCILFSPDDEMRLRSHQTLESVLLAADLEAELDLCFHPVVNTETLAVGGVEALARWTSPVLGVVGPDRFIPMAEDLGIIGQMTLVLLRKVLVQSRRLPTELCVSINLSAKDIVADRIIDAVIAEIKASGFDPRRLIMEITETAVIRNHEIAIPNIARLRALGMRVALDDFGTGFSSLTHLQRLPIDSVKLDRSFAANMEDEVGGKVVAAVAGLCRTLDLTSLIEGIETPAQLRRARQYGYRYVQGYLFAQPMTIEALLRWLDEDRRPPLHGRSLADGRAAGVR